MESAETTSPSSSFASATESAVFPVAVGPHDHDRYQPCLPNCFSSSFCGNLQHHGPSRGGRTAALLPSSTSSAKRSSCAACGFISRLDGRAAGDGVQHPFCLFARGIPRVGQTSLLASSTTRSSTSSGTHVRRDGAHHAQNCRRNPPLPDRCPAKASSLCTSASFSSAESCTVTGHQQHLAAHLASTTAAKDSHTECARGRRACPIRHMLVSRAG